jgi:hypothetical protein
LGAPLADLEALVAAVVAAGGGGALPALFELPRAACQALAACAPEPTAGWACADLVSRLGAPLADLEALVAAVVAAGGGGALPALFELPRAACQAIAAAAGAGALRVVSPICVARALCSLGLLRDSQFIIHFSVVVLPVVLSTV